MTGIRLEDVTVPGRSRPRLRDISLVIEGGLVVLMGPNGSGKSTLLGVLRGAVPSTGTVSVANRALATLRPRERAAHMAWLPQRPRLEDGLTAGEVVVAARYRFHEAHHVSVARAREAMARVRASDWWDCPMGTLSGGEAQRVRLASLIAQEASTWLLDEPGAHLDPAVRLSLLELVGERVADGHTVVLVTHDLTVLSRIGPSPVRVVGLHEGCVAWDLDRSDPRITDALGSLLRLDLRAVQVDGRVGWFVAGAQ